MIIRLIEDLPFFDDNRTVRIPGGPLVKINHNQIILWVSVSPRRAPDDKQAAIPPKTRRFPAVLDPGFNDCLLVNERHLSDWALTDPLALPDTGLPMIIHRPGHEGHRSEAGKGAIQELGKEDTSRSTSISVPVREGWLWLHRPLPKFRDEMSGEPPERLFLWPGIAVVPASTDYPRLPLVGMRALRQNQILIHLDSGKGKVSVEKFVPDTPR